MKKLFISSLGSMVMMAASSGSVLATNNPTSFPPCPNPGGTLVAGYQSGNHQIPGGNLMSGSDYVYKLSDGRYVQCFCPDSGTQGYQSNWIYTGGWSDSQIQTYLNQGYFKINNTNGQWGLPSGWYVVKNSNFDCDRDDCDKPDDHEDHEAKKVDKDKDKDYSFNHHDSARDKVMKYYSSQNHDSPKSESNESSGHMVKAVKDHHATLTSNDLTAAQLLHHLSVR